MFRDGSTCAATVMAAVIEATDAIVMVNSKILSIYISLVWRNGR